MTPTGIVLALVEVALIFGSAYYIRKRDKSTGGNLQHIGMISYYWFIFTIFTGFMWETSFVCQYHAVNEYSAKLIANNQTVWFTPYTWDYLLPWKFAYIFYGDYGAYADREYMINTNDWSRIIESTHAIYCALFSCLALIFKYVKWENHYNIAVGVAMGSQLMNSILYMAEYFVQIDDPDNINYPSSNFPSGILLDKRPFMWVNVFWLLMPSYIITVYLICPSTENNSGNISSSKSLPPLYGSISPEISINNRNVNVDCNNCDGCIQNKDD